MSERRIVRSADRVLACDAGLAVGGYAAYAAGARPSEAFDQ
jgi:hypothetical protein